MFDWLASRGRRRRAAFRFSTVERAIIGAQGKALTMLAARLQARGLLDAAEFAETLAMFGVIVGEEDDLEGRIIAIWATLMKDGLPDEA